jgi:hypothetical protein
VFCESLTLLSSYNSSPALLSRILICVLFKDLYFGCSRGMVVLGVKQNADWFVTGLGVCCYYGNYRAERATSPTRILHSLPSILRKEDAMFLVILISVLFEVYCVVTLRSLTSFHLPD